MSEQAGRERRAAARDVLAYSHQSVLRSGQPAMGGPRYQDYQAADKHIAALAEEGYTITPTDAAGVTISLDTLMLWRDSADALVDESLSALGLLMDIKEAIRAAESAEASGEER